MSYKRLVRIAVIILSLSVVAPINQVAQADDTYERICLTMGWTSCGNFSVYDASGNQLNQVVGPAPLSAFIAYARCQTANVNLCGDSSKVPLGYAVLNYLYSASSPAPAPTPAPTPTPTPAPTPTPTPTSSSTPAPTSSSTPAPTSTPTDSTYQNTCLPAGWTSCGLWVIYANSGAEKNRIVGPSSLSALTATIGCQTSGVNLCMDNRGNPATGYAILSGTYQTGTFISNSLPIVTRSPSPSPTPNPTSTIDTKTATTQSDTKTATTQSDTKTATTQTSTSKSSPVVQNETITATIATIVAISNVESRTASTVNLLQTLTAPEKEGFLNVTVKSTKSAVINVDVVIPDIKVVVTATKNGSKPIVFTVKTDGDGEGQIKTSKNLNGYTVTLAVNGVKLDSDKATKK